MAKDFDFGLMKGVLQDGRDHDREIDRFTASGVAVPWPAPLITASVSPTAAVSTGFYIVQNNVCNAWFSYEFLTAGTGVYNLNLPKPARLLAPLFGRADYLEPIGQFVSAQGALAVQGHVTMVTSSVCVFVYPTSFAGGWNYLSDSAPFAYGVGGMIQGNICYRVADSFNV